MFGCVPNETHDSRRHSSQWMVGVPVFRSRSRVSVGRSREVAWIQLSLSSAASARHLAPGRSGSGVAKSTELPPGAWRVASGVAGSDATHRRTPPVLAKRLAEVRRL